MTQPPYAPPQQQAYGQQPPYGPPPGAPYGQTPQGQPPFGQPPQAPQKTPIWKKTWFRIVAGLFVIAVIASAVNGGDKNNTTASGGSDAPAAVDSAAPAEVVEEAPAEPAMPGLNQPAADGDFSFVVSGVDCSLTEIGNQYFGTKAQGQFCVVSVAVTNIGDSAGAFFGDNSKLLNAEGQEFSADSEAAIYLEESDSLFEEINPGNTLNSKVVFDVPAGTTPTVIELHDSAFSGGVQVALQ